MNFGRLFFFLFLALSSSVSAQIVSIDPVFFTLDDEITITFDASQGSQGLEGVAQVYAHTGIITTQGGAGNWQNVQGNWGTDDPKVKMTNVGGDKHTITYRPRDFYNIGAGVEVVQLSFVFRNVDGSKEGKTANQGDIFVDIPEANTFSAFFRSPSSRFIVASIGSQIEVDIRASSPADIILYDNDVLINSVTNATELIQSVPVTISGDHILRLEASRGDDMVVDQISYTVNPDLTIAELPEDAEPGWNFESEEEAIIVLHAPQKEFVHIIGDLTDWNISADYLLNKTPDGAFFWIRLSDLVPDQQYEYQYLIDGELLIADPLSRLVMDPNHDGFIDQSAFEFLDEYPSGKTEGVISVASLAEDSHVWRYDDVELPKEDDLMIYEILLRDFLADHSYVSLQDTLDYLQRLGINAIELMPIQEFEGNNSWGYNPSYHGALDKYYGSPLQFKSLVDEAHRRGIAVIVDVVYNHAFGQSPLVTMYWDKENNRPAANSPYFNTTARHPFNVGYDFNHESPSTKDFVKQTLTRWIEDYHIDGFRFDLSKGFTQKQSNNNGVFSALDASRVSILQDYADHIWSIDDDSYVILEHFASNTEERVLSDYGMMLWGNANSNFNEATMGYHENGKSDFGNIAAIDQRGWSSNRLIGYMESHDEERLMWKNLQFGNMNGNYNVKNRSVALDRIEMATAFFISIPGPKMFWQFGELGYDLSINRCTDGSVSEGCRLSDKPIRWNYQSDQDRGALYKASSKMIALRKDNEALSTGDYSANTSGPVKEIVRRGQNEDAVVIGNFDVIARSFTPSFTREGRWYDFVSGDSLEVSTNLSIDLRPGEYHIYLSERPDFTVDVEDVFLTDTEMMITPNPSDGQVRILINSEQARRGHLEILDLMGRAVSHEVQFIRTQEKLFEVDINLTLSDGIYFVRWRTEDGVLIQRLVIQ